MEEEKMPLRKLLNNTVSEISQNWEIFNREFGKEWEKQLQDENSPLKKLTGSLPKPAEITETTRDQIVAVIKDVKVLTDSGFNAIRKALRSLR